MLTIRLCRIGRVHQPYFRIVVAEKHRHVTKKAHEVLGTYNPRTKEFKIDAERLRYWLGFGVEASPTVRSLLIKNQFIIK